MPQGIRLFKTITAAQLESRVTARDFRAAAFIPFGCYQGIAFTHELSASTATHAMSCVPPECVAGIHIGNYISNQLPMPFVTFAVADVLQGRLAEVLHDLEGSHETTPDGVFQAFEPVIGSCDFTLVIEVMSMDDRVGARRLLELVDHSALVNVRTLFTFAELTFGFGTPADPVAPTST